VDQPSLNTIKLQIGYDSAYVKQEVSRQQNITNLSHDSNRLIDEIVSFEPRSGNDFEGITLLYKKIFNYLLYKNKQHIIGNYSQIKLTNAINNTIEREVAAALESVLPRAGLRPFVSLTTPEKVAQLCELSNIVIGIRLFNRDIGKGGVGLESFNEIINHPARDLINDLNVEVADIMEQSDKYTMFFNVYNDLASPGNDEIIDYYKQELTYKRQFLIYVLELKSDVQISEQNIESLQAKYVKEIRELQNLIGNKSSIPKDQVYPKFDSLSQIYSQLLEEKNLAVLRKDLFNVLLEYKQTMTNELTDTLIRESKALYAEKAAQLRLVEEHIAQTMKSEIVGDNIIREMPLNTPNFMHIPLDFLGFCLVHIVEQGLLMPGKPNLGVFKYNEKYCVFADQEAIEKFIQNPNYYLDTVIEKCRLMPELIHLLKMQDHFPDASLAALLQGRDGMHPLFSISAPLMVDKGNNCPLHFVEKNIEPNYHWNEWDLRKKALQMANIRRKLTVTTQTELSNFRIDNETQVWLPKENATNTGVNASTNTVLKKTYIVGLRDKNTR